MSLHQYVIGLVFDLLKDMLLVMLVLFAIVKGFKTLKAGLLAAMNYVWMRWG